MQITLEHTPSFPLAAIEDPQIHDRLVVPEDILGQPVAGFITRELYLQRGRLPLSCTSAFHSVWR
jgi:hypothetical protein